MKALTLTQPWATLIALGAKRIETRSWGTRYMGRLAIHAAKVFPNRDRELCMSEPFCHRLLNGDEILVDMPRGAVVATAQLRACIRIASFADVKSRLDRLSTLPKVAEFEEAFGDYSPGRYAWILDDIVPLDRPVPARGALGLWEWRGPR